MKFVGVIPSRYESSRFPGKALADIYGKPMIYWVYKNVIKSKYLEKCFIATDSSKISKACEYYKIPVVMTLDKHINGTERVAEVAGKIDSDIYINIQGDEPLISSEVVDAVINSFINYKTLEYAQAVKKITSLSDFVDTTVVKIAVDYRGYALYLSRSPIPYPRDSTNFKTYKHIGVYGYNKSFLMEYLRMGESPLEAIEGLEQLRALENGKRLKVVEVEQDTVSVDTPSDLKKIISAYGTRFGE